MAGRCIYLVWIINACVFCSGGSALRDAAPAALLTLARVSSRNGSRGPASSPLVTYVSCQLKCLNRTHCFGLGATIKSTDIIIIYTSVFLQTLISCDFISLIHKCLNSSRRSWWVFHSQVNEGTLLWQHPRTCSKQQTVTHTKPYLLKRFKKTMVYSGQSLWWDVNIFLSVSVYLHIVIGYISSS